MRTATTGGESGQSLHPRFKRFLGWMLGALGLLVLLVPTGLSLFSEANAALSLLVSLLLALPGAGLFILAKRLLARSALALLEQDPRPPILYLRSFSGDGKKLWGPRLWFTSGWLRKTLRSRRRMPRRFILYPEQQLFLALRALGPFVAIGKPGDQLPPLGAARMYMGDSWQEQVMALLARAQLVVIQVGDSDGLLWELRQVLSTISPRRVILCLPMDKTEEGIDQALYERFREKTRELFPVELPREVTPRFMFFDEDWTPRILIPKRGTPLPLPERRDSAERVQLSALQGLKREFLQVRTPLILRGLLFSMGLALVVLVFGLIEIQTEVGERVLQITTELQLPDEVERGRLPDWETWWEFRWDEAGATIRFPVAPVINRLSVETSVGPADVVIATAQAGHAMFVLSWSDIPGEKPLPSAQRLLEGARDGVLTQVGWTLVRSEEREWGGHPGLFSVMAVGSASSTGGGAYEVHGAYTLVGRRLYMAHAFVPSEPRATAPELALFFDSFRVLGGSIGLEAPRELIRDRDQAVAP